MSSSQLTSPYFPTRRTHLIQASYRDYIPFVDPVIGKHCANIWGDGKGITYAQAAAVTDLTVPGEQTSYLSGNRFTDLRWAITSFDEFRYFTGLTRLYMPGYVGDFFTCERLTVPETVTLIEAHGLRYLDTDAPNKCVLTMLSATPPTLTSIYAFLGTVLREIRVPAGSVNAYKTASIWSDLADLIVADI